MRRYSVHIEDVVTGAEVRVSGAFTRWGMVRRVRRGNGRVNGEPIRFFGKDNRKDW
jgi:hypothetical protein